jgi:hypothetical protein
MKKILVIFALLALVIGVQAQDATIKKAGKAGYYTNVATLCSPMWQLTTTM